MSPRAATASVILHAALGLAALGFGLPNRPAEPDQHAEIELLIGNFAQSAGPQAATPVPPTPPPAPATPQAAPKAAADTAPPTTAADKPARATAPPPPASDTVEASAAPPPPSPDAAADPGSIPAGQPAKMAGTDAASTQAAQSSPSPPPAPKPPAPAQAQSPPAQGPKPTTTAAATPPTPKPAPAKSTPPAQDYASVPMPPPVPARPGLPADDIHVGEGIAAPFAEVAQAGLLHPAQAEIGNIPPEYPPDAGRRRDRGTVVIRMIVGADGQVTSANVLHSSGVRSLDRAARDRLATWHFQPAQLNGHKVPDIVDRTINFVPD